jgi:hypothetical protein
VKCNLILRFYRIQLAYVPRILLLGMRLKKLYVTLLMGLVNIEAEVRDELLGKLKTLYSAVYNMQYFGRPLYGRECIEGIQFCLARKLPLSTALHGSSRLARGGNSSVNIQGYF